MNVYIFAERAISYTNKRGELCKSYQTEKFDAIQTPTTVTQTIISSTDPKQAYIDYLVSLTNIIKVNIYDSDDVFCEREPIGTEDYNWVAEHLSRFNSWFETIEEDGYVVKFEQI